MLCTLSNYAAVIAHIQILNDGIFHGPDSVVICSMYNSLGTEEGEQLDKLISWSPSLPLRGTIDPQIWGSWRS